MISAQVEKKDIREGEDQILHSPHCGRGGRVGVKEIAADQDGCDVLTRSIETEPPECVQQLCASYCG